MDKSLKNKLKGLSKRQKEVLKKIKSFYVNKGYFPSVRELSRVLQVRSPNTTYNHIQTLIQNGFLEKNNKGQIIACNGICDDPQTLGKYLVKNTKNSFTLKVKEEAFKDFYIKYGDILIIEKNQFPRAGKIILLKQKNNFKLKKVIKEKNTLGMIDENGKFQKLSNENKKNILGIIKELIRKY